MWLELLTGESGDDFIYGMLGRDILFGDAQDDDIIGGYGHDWISGGTGQDGVIGDDGRIYTSRNDTELPEPLYGIAIVETDRNSDHLEISTPGDIQVAEINIVGQLKKTVNLTPFNLTPDLDEMGRSQMDDPLFEPIYADDIIYGGLGDDFLHGSSGDDAISGAEALPEFFDQPTNPGNVLQFDADRIEFAAYDEDEPLAKIAGFLLNFDDNIADGDPIEQDGDDAIFGDLGNDWLVGGTDRDRLYGGFGADLLDADDLKEVDGDHTNQGPDGPDFTQQDLAFGGAGRDVLIANTGGDRLIDWIGEFNSFIVPFAPFGEFTVTRAVFPALFEFLYDLSEADGADPTRADDTAAGSSTAAERNGEPDGELGLITQKDGSLWQEQTGAPIDPQPGNIPGGERLTLRGVDFNGGSAAGFAADSGQWEVTGGRLEVSPTLLGEDAVSVFHVGEYLPGYFEMVATINAGKPTAGLKSNAYLIFDYYGPTDFKFAGVNISTDKMQMGHRDAEGWHIDAQTPARLKPNRDYQVLLAINGVTATLLVDGSMLFSYAFAPRMDPDGFTYGLNAGFVGIGAENSFARIDNVIVQRLKPEVTFSQADDFSDGVADLLTDPIVGDWQISDGRLVGMPAAGEDAALATFDLDVAPNSWLELEATLTAESLGGFFFDYYGERDYKFAGIVPEANQVVIGHWSRQSALKVDAVADLGFSTGPEVDLTVSLKGTTVSVTVDGHEVLGHVFYSVVVDGAFGLLTDGGDSSFASASMATDDPAFLVESGDSLRVEQGAISGSTLVGPSSLELQPLIAEATRRWTELGAAVPDVDVWITDLPDDHLGLALEGRVYLDVDGAGHGWFIDPTPSEDSEFSVRLEDGGWMAPEGSEAFGAADLLGVLFHELGHTIGLDHGELEALTGSPELESLSVRHASASDGGNRADLLAMPEARLAQPEIALVEGAGSIVSAPTLPFGLDPRSLEAVVGEGSEVSRSARLEPGVSLRERVHVQPKAVIGAAARIGTDSFIGKGATIGSRARIGESVTVEPGAVVPEGTIVLEGTTVAAEWGVRAPRFADPASGLAAEFDADADIEGAPEPVGLLDRLYPAAAGLALVASAAQRPLPPTSRRRPASISFIGP
ncbi:MAG: hypothetical protein IH974_11500 [Myxococcales bacterium]|nr:hypothetical protein [Myxococcales bacterium]